MARKKKAEAHHGGAWKVAYADFVTAMMALFMVLWICAQDKKILISTSRYFQQPFTSPMQASSGIMPMDTNKPTKPKGEDSGADSRSSSVNQMDLQFLTSVAKDFVRLLDLEKDAPDKPIDIQVTSDGLRIILYDRARKALFAEKTAEFTEWGRFVMQSLAWTIDRNHFRVVIEGHTRRGLDLPKPEYGPWELSADRANTARRSLTFYAVDPKLIERVTGFADTRPIPFQAPEAEMNQRITLSLTMARGKEKEAPASAKALARTLPAEVVEQTIAPGSATTTRAKNSGKPGTTLSSTP